MHTLVYTHFLFKKRCAENCKKLAKNWTFFEEIAQNRRFWALLPNFMGHIWDICGPTSRYTCGLMCLHIGHRMWKGFAQKLQKIGIFSEKRLIYAYFEQFWAKSWDICTQMDVHKNCTFFAIFHEKVTKIEEILTFRPFSWDICGISLEFEMCKKLQFFSLFSGFTIQFVLESTDFMGDMWHICGSLCAQKLQKIGIFLRKRPNFLGNERFSSISWDICGTYVRSQLCKKLQFFSSFWAESAQNLGNKHFWAVFMGNNGTYSGCTKIAKNCSFFGKIAQNRRFWAISAEIMGHIHETSCVPKFTRQTAHRHIHAHRAAHYARRQPRAARRAPAQGRIRVKDLRALCMRSPRHVLKGVYEVNHRQVHVHTYTQGLAKKRDKEKLKRRREE